MKSHRTTMVAAVLVAGLLTGCTSSTAVTGAAVGTGIGAVAGQAIGGDTRSTVGGAGAGMLLGGVLGTAAAPLHEPTYCRYKRPDGTINVRRC
jgi:hypothetical protein